MKCLALLLLAAVVAPSACVKKKVRYDNYAVYRLSIDNAIQLSIAKQLSQTQEGYNVLRSFAGVGSEFEIMVSPKVLTSFTALTKLYSFRTKLLIPNVQTLIDNEMKPKPANASFTFDVYHTLEEIYGWLDELPNRFPGVASTFSIGKTYEGRDIRGIKIKHKNAKSSVFVIATIIPHDWNAGAAALYVINEILTDPYQTRVYTDLVDWYIIPIYNPDGYVYTHDYSRVWTKNRNAPSDWDCVGASLDFNFNFGWSRINPSCSYRYGGPEPFSEAETKALATYIKSLNNIGVFVSLSAAGRLILTPYTYSSKRPDNFDDLIEIAKATVRNIYVETRTVYEYGTSNSYYGAEHGSVLDWAQEEIPGRCAALKYVVGDPYYSIFLPEEFIIPVGRETLKGLCETVFKSLELGYIKL